jgi:hypothetical protein
MLSVVSIPTRHIESGTPCRSKTQGRSEMGLPSRAYPHLNLVLSEAMRAMFRSELLSQ